MIKRSKHPVEISDLFLYEFNLMKFKVNRCKLDSTKYERKNMDLPKKSIIFTVQLSTCDNVFQFIFAIKKSDLIQILLILELTFSLTMSLTLFVCYVFWPNDWVVALVTIISRDHFQFKTFFPLQMSLPL